ncbi:SAM-dependent methyltransferase [Nocardia sp. NPDC050697]|uniref:SAM-dependent methyltransferase n=1 Tax=Nocardia sp. NPDC050697 TaxID=3155158 RepID=UPI0033ED19AF
MGGWDSFEAAGFDVNRAQSARVYNRLLGGKDNYHMDQAAAARVEQAFPSAAQAARANRNFMVCSTRYLAEAGVSQFLDIGVGIPEKPDLHEVAQEVNPAARVVHVDNDVVVLAHARALLCGTEQGRVEVLEADARDPVAMMRTVRGSGVLDFSQPVAVSLIGILPLLGSGDEPYAIVDAVTDALAPGSYLSTTHLTADFDAKAIGAVVEVYEEHGIGVRARTREEFARFFEGRELIAPGITTPDRWRPRAGPVQSSVTDASAAPRTGPLLVTLERRRDARNSMYAGVARVL